MFQRSDRAGDMPRPYHNRQNLIERCGFLKDGRMVEVARSYFRGDAYDVVDPAGSPPFNTLRRSL